MRSLFIGVLLCTIAGTTQAGTITNNVALGKTVFAVSGAATQIPSAALSAIVDGIFLPDQTSYIPAAPSAVEWQSSINSGTPVGDVTPTGMLIEIDLGSIYTISGTIVQADNNDSYLLQYHNLSTQAWDTLLIVPATTANGLGLITRPFSGINHNLLQDVPPINTDAVRISGLSSNDQQGHAGFAVSEVQLQGALAAVPLPPASWAGLGMLGILIPLKSFNKRRISA